MGLAAIFRLFMQIAVGNFLSLLFRRITSSAPFSLTDSSTGPPFSTAISPNAITRNYI